MCHPILRIDRPGPAIGVNGELVPCVNGTEWESGTHTGLDSRGTDVGDPRGPGQQVVEPRTRPYTIKHSKNQMVFVNHTIFAMH